MSIISADEDRQGSNMMGRVPNQEAVVQNDVIFIKMGPVTKHPKTYLRVRVMKWINQINPFESRQKSKLTLFDPSDLQAGTETFPIVEAFCFNAL